MNPKQKQRKNFQSDITNLHRKEHTKNAVFLGSFTFPMQSQLASHETCRDDTNLHKSRVQNHKNIMIAYFLCLVSCWDFLVNFLPLIPSQLSQNYPIVHLSLMARETQSKDCKNLKKPSRASLTSLPWESHISLSSIHTYIYI